jgi:hypothetical protein
VQPERVVTAVLGGAVSVQSLVLWVREEIVRDGGPWTPGGPSWKSGSINKYMA